MQRYPHPCRPDELKFSTYCIKREQKHCTFIQKDLDIIKKLLLKLITPKRNSLFSPRKRSPLRRSRIASAFNNSARKIKMA